MGATYLHAVVHPTGHPAAVANDYNPAERYPAEGEHWYDFEIISVGEAVLLSLGIEPRDIRDPDDEKNGLRDGLQGREYLRRVAVIRNAIAAKVLAKAVTDDPDYSDHVGFKEFVAWAAGKGWQMPEWMLGLNVSQATTVTPLPPVEASDPVMPPTPSGKLMQGWTFGLVPEAAGRGLKIMLVS